MRGDKFKKIAVGGDKFKKIGSNVQIVDMSSLHYKENIIIGNNVYIGPGAYIWAIGGLKIGDSAMLCPGVEIGDGAVVAMGAVVSSNVPPCQ